MTELNNKPIDWDKIDSLSDDENKPKDDENNINIESDIEDIISAAPEEYDFDPMDLDFELESFIIGEPEADDISEDIVIVENDIPEEVKPKRSHFMRRAPKKTEELDEFDLFIPKPEGFELDSTTLAWSELIQGDDSRRLNELKELVHSILQEKTDINILNNRRKPSKTNFNIYYTILAKELVGLKYSYSEILVELSYYFSDNLFNMFKMLDKKWGTIILNELQEKYDINLDDMDIF